MKTNLSSVAWKGRNEYLHHWEVLSRLISEASSGKDVNENLTIVEGLIQGALSIYKRFESNDKKVVQFKEISSKANLLAWQNAIRLFKRKVEMIDG